MGDVRVILVGDDAVGLTEELSLGSVAAEGVL